MEQENRMILGLRAAALLETVIFLAALLVIDRLLGPGNRFFNVCPHPFWIIVLLVTCQYGTAEGLMAAVLSTLALLLFNMPPHVIGQNMYDYLYAVSKTPLLWIIAAVTLGELRYRHLNERRTLQNSLADAEQREEKIAQSYEWVKSGKEKLEERIAGQLRSSVAAYQAAKAMEALSGPQVLSGLEALVAAVLNPERFSIYLMEGESLNLALSHGWRESDAYQQRFTSASALYQAVIGKRRTLCVANAEQEAILAGQGVLAGSLVDRESGETFGMLKVEVLGFSELNLSSIGTFSAVCDWAGMALANANKYQQAKSESIINPDHQLFSSNYFTRYTQHITALARRAGFDVSQVSVKFANADALSMEGLAAVSRALADAVTSTLRSVDLAFDYQPVSGEFSIVLPATDRKGADIVAGKIRIAMAERLKGSVRNADLNFSLQTLHEK